MIRASLSIPFLIILSALLFWGCDKSRTPTQAPSLPPVLRETDVSRLTFTDTLGAAIGADAKVLIGPKQGEPFTDNLLATDESGQIEIPETWTTRLPVTIEASGFVRTTYLNLEPKTRTLEIRKEPNRARVEISGITTNFGNLPRDGFVDVGLLLSPLTRSQLLNFESSSLISPIEDRVRLPLGKSLKVPSNLSIPSQRENYVVPLTLDKPLYKVLLEPRADAHLYALHARFPLKEVADGVKGGQNIFDLVGLFEITSFGSREIDATENRSNQDIAVDQSALQSSISVQAPAYASNLVVLTSALAPISTSYFITDLKTIESGQSINLKFPTEMSASDAVVASFLRKKATSGGGYRGVAADEYSAVLTDSENRAPLNFLPMIVAPRVEDKTILTASPSSLEDITPRGMYLIRSGITTLQDGRVSIENRAPEWDVFSETWTDKVELPQLGTQIASTAATHRWEVMFLGSRNEANNVVYNLGPRVLESVSHVTKNAVEF